MLDAPLDRRNDLAGIALEPVPVERFGNHPELDDEIVREVFRLSFTALLAPEAEQGSLVVALMMRASEPPMK
jgi:hypothetical protein